MKTTIVTRLLLAGMLATSFVPGTAGAAAPSESQRCESAVDLASGKLLACRLAAEAAYAGSGDATKRGDALAKCASAYTEEFQKAVKKYGPGDCPATPEAAFADHVGRCADDVVAVAQGGAFPACGDGAVNLAGELCDGADLGGTSCTTLGFRGGTLGCDASCGFDTSGCVGPGLAATGQTTCSSDNGASIACAGTGQDGELRAGAPSALVDNGDGTITDRNTGLVWEKLSDDGGIHDKDTSYTWQAGFTRVASLNAASFAGYSDWRVPNQKELESIVDYGRSNPAIASAFQNGCTPGCSVTACSCATSQVYTWSSTTLQDVQNFAWAVWTADGSSVNLQKIADWGVRAVRGGNP
ncbi:DUF1566 domain-containing protein [Candidatus Binatia bacterium]|jgi:hypothetical protein|nr:DUF1566 domain-containing protein [Candidatus Binatia bacterium]